jgi:hypothetical protein
VRKRVQKIKQALASVGVIEDPQAEPVIAVVDGHRYELWPEEASRLPESSTTLETSAGCSALTMKVAGSADHGMMSIFSPCISPTTA